MFSEVRSLLALTLVLCALSPCFAQWSEPVFLPELNAHGIAAMPRVTADQLTILFMADGSLYEATRESVGEPFGVPIHLSEFDGLFDFWMSADGLTCYYAKVIGLPQGSQRLVFKAVRSSNTAPWETVGRLDEIHQFFNQSIDSQASLTSDEMLITWTSYAHGDTARTYYQASRTVPENPFTGVRELSELTAHAPAWPWLSADGLEVYFSLNNDEGFGELYGARRSSLDSSFSDFAPLTELNGPGISNVQPSLTPDGKTLYFFSRRMVDGELLRGIWVSHMREWHVSENGDDSNDGLTRETAYATVQKAVDSAQVEDTILIWPGSYSESVIVIDKAVHVLAADVPPVFNGSDLLFYQAGASGCTLRNLIFVDSAAVLNCMNASPLFTHLTFVHCGKAVSVGGQSEPRLRNSILHDVVTPFDGGCIAEHNWIGAAQEDPGFADAEAGDYHLRSEWGRYTPTDEGGYWLLDEETSPAVDAGDPAVRPAKEPMPNGGRVNLGAYGNTPYASRSPWPIASDLNRDGRVGLTDLAEMAGDWMKTLPWAE